MSCYAYKYNTEILKILSEVQSVRFQRIPVLTNPLAILTNNNRRRKSHVCILLLSVLFLTSGMVFSASKRDFQMMSFLAG